MELINKGFFSGIMYFIITIIGIYLFFNFLFPVVLLVLIVWGTRKAAKAFKNRKVKNIVDESSMDSEVQSFIKDEFNIENVVDVDFTEIKK